MDIQRVSLEKLKEECFEDFIGQFTPDENNRQNFTVMDLRRAYRVGWASGVHHETTSNQTKESQGGIGYSKVREG